MSVVADSLRSNDYYSQAREGSLDLDHPAIKILKQYIGSANKVIDLGCGEGTRLNNLVIKQQAVGVDYNSTAIKTAQKQYPKMKFIQTDLTKLPFKNESFDLAFSTYVLEHLDDPEEMLNEAKRVLSLNGLLVLIAPNFGAPNRRSPNSNQNKLSKLFKGTISDLLSLIRVSESRLNWEKVQPKSDRYTIDADTVVEPHIITLMKYAKYINMNCLKATSCWSEDQFSIYQLGFKILGTMGVYPFCYWGPHLCLVLQKGSDD